MSEDMVPYVTDRKRMTKAEERKAVELLGKVEHAYRFVLLDMFERGAHIVTGYPNFEDYCRDRLHLTHDKHHLSRLLRAARVEKAVTHTSSYCMQQLDEIKNPEITLRVAAEIGRAPQEKWQAIYDRFSEISRGDTYLTKGALTELRHLVNAAKPPVYDGTPEQQAAEAAMESAISDAQEPRTDDLEPDTVNQPPAIDPAAQGLIFMRCFVDAYGGNDQEALVVLYHDVRQYLAGL